MRIEIGKKIFQKRQELGFSQIELAKRAGIAQSTLSYIEKNKKRPQFETMSAICKVLGITVLDLLTYDEKPSSSNVFKDTIAAYGIGASGALPDDKSLRINNFDKYLYDLYLAQTGT